MESLLIDYKKHLQTQPLSLTTINSNLNGVLQLLNYLKKEEISYQDTTYNTILDYLSYCRKKGNKHQTLKWKVACIKRFYNYLNPKENPTTELLIKRRNKNHPT